MRRWLIGLLLLVSVAGLLAMLRHLARRAAFGGREILDLDEIHAQLQPAVSRTSVEEVWNRLGQAYSVQPGAIRATDTMGTFAGIDSWDLWKGGESLAGWIHELKLEDLAAKPDVTVLELAGRVEAARGASRS